MDALINPQLGSKFFLVPAEIRYAIYVQLIPHQIHLFRHEERLRISECVQCHDDDHPDCTQQMWNDDNTLVSGGSSWERLRSSWGTHWRCEESVLIYKAGHRGINCGTTATVLPLVCKRMFIDTAKAIASIATLYLHDIDTLGLLLSRLNVLISGQFSSFSILNCIIPNLKELSIHMRLPLSFLETLGNNESTPNSESSPMGDQISSWIGLRSGIEKLPKLRRLRIWLDHEERSPWSAINERAALSPLLSLTDNTNLDIAIDLPELDPGLKSSDRHFTEDSLPPALTLNRRRVRDELKDPTMQELVDLQIEVWQNWHYSNFPQSATST